MMKQMRQDANNDKESLFKLMQATKERIDYRQELKKVQVPTLVIQGQKDLLFPVHMAQEVANAISDAKLEVIPFAGHTLNLEAVPQMSSIIKKFIES
jgi:3-oxoadipate enol-lactonase